MRLRCDKVFDEGIGGLGVQREGVLQRLELLRLVDVGHLEAVAAGVQVLLDDVQGALQHHTLLGREAPLTLL